MNHVLYQCWALTILTVTFIQNFTVLKNTQIIIMACNNKISSVLKTKYDYKQKCISYTKITLVHILKLDYQIIQLIKAMGVVRHTLALASTNVEWVAIIVKAMLLRSSIDFQFLVKFITHRKLYNCTVCGNFYNTGL